MRERGAGESPADASPDRQTSSAARRRGRARWIGGAVGGALAGLLLLPLVAVAFVKTTGRQLWVAGGNWVIQIGDSALIPPDPALQHPPPHTLIGFPLSRDHICWPKAANDLGAITWALNDCAMTTLMRP